MILAGTAVHLGRRAHTAMAGAPPRCRGPESTVATTNVCTEVIWSSCRKDLSSEPLKVLIFVP
uniref:Uncharacterized protein n=1 Tax=Arundo donax TaxID=35708 RepID=A0A0A9A0H1_ARUDO